MNNSQTGKNREEAYLVRLQLWRTEIVRENKINKMDLDSYFIGDHVTDEMWAGYI